AELRKRRPELRVLILSMYDNEQFLFEALKAGAAVYVLKSGADGDIVNACRAAMRGEPFLYPAAIQALIRDLIEQSNERGEVFEPLTSRELEVLKADRGRRELEGDRRAARPEREDGRAPPLEH